MFRDQRLNKAEALIDTGQIKVLSLDLFDTLLARRVPAPPDIFLKMGLKLQKTNQLGPGIKPDSFAAIRYQTEYAARGKRQEAHGDREITIHEIYQEFPPHIVVDSLSMTDLVKLELETENEAAFANDEMIKLAHYAKERGLLLALISNTYIPEKDLMEIVRTAAPDLPKPDKVFISGENRMGKRTGLMKKMCTDLGIDPKAVLHIGDNPISDKQAAEETGLTFIDYGPSPDGFEATLTEEHPRQWFARAEQFGMVGGDGGMTWLRKQSSFWVPPRNVPEEHEPFYRLGTRLLGPLLTGFAGWVAQRMKEENGAKLFGLMREGDLLTQIVQMHAPHQPCSLLPVSRMSVALATFTPDHPAYLQDFLTRRGFWPIGTLIEQLGFHRERAQEIADPNLTLDTLSAKELTHRLIEGPLADELFEKSANRRARLMIQLKSSGALDMSKLFLCDLGYAATIQRGLQRVLTIEKQPITTHGLYAVAVHVSLGTQREGGIVEGFMAQNGNPNDFSCAYGRSPEVIELFCLPPYGSVKDYEQDGTPIFDPDTRSDRQVAETASAQQGIMDFAKAFIDLNATAPSFTSEAWRAQMRQIALRIIAHPTSQEAHTIAHWVTDSDMGLATPRPLLSAGQYEDRIINMSVAELATLPRRDVPWLFGVAAARSYATGRQVVRLNMRHEKPEAF